MQNPVLYVRPEKTARNTDLRATGDTGVDDVEDYSDGASWMGQGGGNWKPRGCGIESHSGSSQTA